MWYFKTEKKDEFLKGRKISWISYFTGMTQGYLSRVLNGKTGCSRVVAVCLGFIGGTDNYLYYFKKGE